MTDARGERSTCQSSSGRPGRRGGYHIPHRSLAICLIPTQSKTGLIRACCAQESRSLHACAAAQSGGLLRQSADRSAREQLVGSRRAHREASRAGRWGGGGEAVRKPPRGVAKMRRPVSCVKARRATSVNQYISVSVCDIQIQLKALANFAKRSTTWTSQNAAAIGI